MRNLAIAAIIVLLIEPEQITGPSFQMSFAAVALLIAGAELMRERRDQSGERPWLWQQFGKAGRAALAIIGDNGDCLHRDDPVRHIPLSDP